MVYVLKAQIFTGIKRDRKASTEEVERYTILLSFQYFYLTSVVMLFEALPNLQPNLQMNIYLLKKLYKMGMQLIECSLSP